MTTATISGLVTDSTGAVLPGTKVVIQNEDTGVARTVQADASGRYSASSLGLGNYQLTAGKEGFQTEVRKGIVLTLGREAVVDLQLTVGAVTQTVEVTEEAPLVQTTESTVSYLVNDSTIRDLPLNGRDVTQLIVLQPGVSLAVNGTNNTASSGFGKRVSISGLRGEDNAYLLDGAYINDFERHIPAGPSNSLLGVETVREFQVLTNSYSARYGRALGGVFNAVSKSGTNEWHGDLYEFLRNSSLDARNFFDRKAFSTDPRLPPFRRNQFGATFGGPIRKDKTFFFVAYEGMRESLNSTLFSNVPDANAHLGCLPAVGRNDQGCPAGYQNVGVSSKIAPYLVYFPLPSPQGRNFNDGTAQYIFQANQPTKENFGLIRLDHQFSASDSLLGRYTGSNSNRSLSLSYPVFRQNGSLGTNLATISETHIFSAHSLNTARISLNRVTPADAGTYQDAPPGLQSVPGQPLPGLAPGSGIASFSGFIRGDNWYAGNRFDYQDDVNLTLGNHSIEFGGMYERFQLNENEPDQPNGTWTFPSLSSFLQAIPTAYRGTPPQGGFNSVRGYRQRFFGLYLQDDWRVRHSLTLNIGLRWDPYTPVTEVNGKLSNLRFLTDSAPTVGDPFWKNHSWKDIGPRFGFAWSPLASGKTSVRGGFGLFFTPIDSAVYHTTTTRTAPFYPQLSFNNPTHFPNALAEIAADSATSFGSVSSVPFADSKSPRALQYNFNLERQLGANNLLTLGYTGSRGIHLISTGDYNSPQPQWDGVSLAFPANAVVLNPNFSSIKYVSTNSNSRYNGLIVAFQRRFSAGLQAQVSYTFSKAMSDSDSIYVTNNVSGGGAGYLQFPRNMSANTSLSGYDFRNLLTINYSYDLPLGKKTSGVTGHLLSGWQWTGILTLQSGQPFWVTAAVSPALTALSVQARSPNLVPGFTREQITLGRPDQYFNPKAYSAPGTRELGNLGRNTLIGPGLAKWDLGLAKVTSLTERLRLQFRGEFFNLLNRANFSVPASSAFSGTGGLVGSAGVITNTVTTSRQIQFGLKLIF